MMNASSPVGRPRTLVPRPARKRGSERDVGTMKRLLDLDGGGLPLTAWSSSPTAIWGSTRSCSPDPEPDPRRLR